MWTLKLFKNVETFRNNKVHMTHQGASVFVAGLKVKYFSTHHKSVPNNLFEAFRMVSGVVLQLVFKQCSNLQFYLWLCSTLQQMRLPYSFFEP